MLSAHRTLNLPAHAPPELPVRRAFNADRRASVYAHSPAPIEPRGGLRILSPAAGSIIAWDPEIPERLQRIPLRVEADREAHWRINGIPLPVGTQTWTPDKPGVHRVSVHRTLEGPAEDFVEIQSRGTRTNLLRADLNDASQ
jgi:hypothetical protein